MQDAMDFGQPRQNAFAFPVSLAIKYQPKIKDFIGLEGPKRTLLGLIKKPRPCAILAIGAPGTGKTSAGMALAEEMPTSLNHLRSQSCDVAALERTWEHCQYYPAKGNFHLALIDEIQHTSDKTQLQWLSYGDGTASLRPMMFGGFEAGQAPPVIWYLTCNGVGPKQTDPPTGLLAALTQRCMVLRFEAPEPAKTAAYLRWVWEREGGPKRYPSEYFESLAKGIGVRDALMRLDVELLAPRSPKEIREQLAADREVAAKAEAARSEITLVDPERSAAARRAWVTMRTDRANQAAAAQ